MRYKAMAERFRQVVGLRDPLPAALALDAGGAEAAHENTVRKNREMDGNEGSGGNENTVRKEDGAEAGATSCGMSGVACCSPGRACENTVRKISLEESVTVGKARKRAEEFFGKCGASMRGAYAELERRLGPDSVPPETVAAERARQGLSPKPGFAERFVAAVLA